MSGPETKGPSSSITKASSRISGPSIDSDYYVVGDRRVSWSKFALAAIGEASEALHFAELHSDNSVVVAGRFAQKIAPIVSELMRSHASEADFQRLSSPPCLEAAVLEARRSDVTANFARFCDLGIHYAEHKSIESLFGAFRGLVAATNTFTSNRWVRDLRIERDYGPADPSLN